jgi:hypothetical protein
MFLQILKSNKAFNLILFPLIGAVLWLPSLISPKKYPFTPGEDQSILFSPLMKLVDSKPSMEVLISLFLMVVLAFSIQKINSQYSFFRIRTLLPFHLLILFIGGLPALHTLHPVYFASIFFVFALDREFRAFKKKSFYSHSFDTGLLIGLGSLFYPPMLFLFPSLMVGMWMINQECNWRHLVLLFWGLILPWIVAFSGFYLAGSGGEPLRILRIHLSLSLHYLTGNVPLQIFSGFWVFLLAVGTLLGLSRFDEHKISTRKYYTVFLLLSVTLIIVFLLAPFVSVESLILLAVPSVFIVSNALLSFRIRFLAEVVLALLAGLIIYMQIA